jgi:peptide/nickel transport system substrate-binding protein
MWGTVGVNVTIDEVGGLVGDNRVFIQHDFDVAPYDYTTNGDPALGIARVYTTTSIGTSYGNGSGYSNPQVDQLFASAQVAGTQAARATYYQQVQAILAKDLPVLTIHQDDEQDAVSKRVHLLWAAQNDGEWGEAWVSPA